MREVTGKETTEKGGGKVNKKMIVESNRGKEKEKKKRESRKAECLRRSERNRLERERKREEY